MNRKKYFLAMFLNMMFFSAISKILKDIWGADYYTNAWILYTFLCINLILTAYFTIRRCHDLGKNGWYAILVYIPLVPLYFIFARGTKGRNMYG